MVNLRGLFVFVSFWTRGIILWYSDASFSLDAETVYGVLDRRFHQLGSWTTRCSLFDFACISKSSKRWLTAVECAQLWLLIIEQIVWLPTVVIQLLSTCYRMNNQFINGSFWLTMVVDYGWQWLFFALVIVRCTKSHHLQFHIPYLYLKPMWQT